MKNLETKRLILRKYKEDDFHAVHQYVNCAENLTYMTFGPNNEAQTRDHIRRVIAQENPNYDFVVTLKDTGQLIGGCSISPDGCEGEMGWILHRDYWKQGYGAEFGQALLSFGFDELKLHRITARCDAENYGSYRVMEKIGMRREGLFYDARPAHKKSEREYSDELFYAILKSEWETAKDIAYYNALPLEFNGFIDVPILTNGDIYNGNIYLVCTEKEPGDPEKNWIPCYIFAVCKNGEKIGDVSIRIGYGGGPKNDNLYYGGQVGYNIGEAHRGNGYALEACKLLLPIARAHKMSKLLITNDYKNTASRRVCEKLSAKLVRLARLPEWNDMYKDGQRFSNIFEWSI